MRRRVLALATALAVLTPSTAYAFDYGNGTYTDNVTNMDNYTYGNQAQIAVLNPYVYPTSYKVESLFAVRTDETAWVEVGWCKYGMNCPAGLPKVPTMFYAVYNNGYYEDIDVQEVPVNSAYFYAMRYIGVDGNGSSKWYFYLNDVWKGYELVINGRLSSAWAYSQSETHYQVAPSQYDDAKGHFYGMTYFDGSVWRPWNSLESWTDGNPLYYVLKVTNTEWWNLHP